MNVKRIGILVYPDVEELDVVGVYEVLASIQTLVDEGSLDVKSPVQVEINGTRERIVCANRMILVPHRVGWDLSEYDMIIVPGGKGVRDVIEDDALVEKIKSFAEKRDVCSVCTGALMLGAAGILRNRTITTHHSAINKLSQIAKVVDKRVVIDGNVITAAGVASSIPLGLALIQKIHGKKVAEIIADELEIPSQLLYS